jgi:dihydroorotate dehydrogenase
MSEGAEVGNATGRAVGRSSLPVLEALVGNLEAHLGQGERAIEDVRSDTELQDALTRAREGLRGHLSDRAAAEVELRRMLFRRGLIDVLAASGVPHVYNFREPFDANIKGPSDQVPDAYPAEQPAWKLLGLPVRYPIGVPASVLTVNSRWVEYYARRGFNVLTYKTVRSRRWEAHPFPNWVFLDDLREPLSPGTDFARITARGGADSYLADPKAYSMANSFGVPSLEPPAWQRDVERAQSVLQEGQLLIVSVMGSYEEYSGRDLIDDFAQVARMAEDVGPHAIELNLSCPNTVDHTGSGMKPPICEIAETTAQIVQAVRDALRDKETPLVAKLSYLPKERLSEVVGSIAEMVDAIAGINTIPVPVRDGQGNPTFRGTAHDPSRDRLVAGVSGIAIRDLALDFTRSVANLERQHEWGLEVLAMGGVMDSHDVRALMASGADAVQAATAAVNNPHLPKHVRGEAKTGDQLVEDVHRALADDRWDFRTIEGIARQLGRDPHEIETVLEQHPEIARESILRDRAGGRVLTAAERRLTLREHIARVRSILAR